MFNKIDETRILDRRAWRRYRKLIENASYSGYTEKRHILPKAKDCWPEYAKEPDNIVRLSARAHSTISGLVWQSDFRFRSYG